MRPWSILRDRRRARLLEQRNRYLVELVRGLLPVDRREGPPRPRWLEDLLVQSRAVNPPSATSPAIEAARWTTADIEAAS